ncbi:hypothetical protein [Glycomyces tarimensis]
MNSLLHAMRVCNGEEEVQVVLCGFPFETIRDRIESAIELDYGKSKKYGLDLSLQEVHSCYALLISVKDQLSASEEDFNLKVGFFRDHASELAQGILNAMSYPKAEGGPASNGHGRLT